MALVVFFHPIGFEDNLIPWIDEIPGQFEGSQRLAHNGSDGCWVAIIVRPGKCRYFCWINRHGWLNLRSSEACVKFLRVEKKSWQNPDTFCLCSRRRGLAFCQNEQVMIELIQFPYSPFCIVQRRILEFSGSRFEIRNIPSMDRGLIWKLSRQRYYQVPILRDGGNVVFETDDNSQVIAKYIDEKLHLGLFPKKWDGVQDLIWRFLENEVEAVGFKLNDIYYEEFVPPKERLLFLRHKERKFGRGCLEKWKEEQQWLIAELEERLLPCEKMLATREFLLDDRPCFVDFDLFGMLGNFLYSGHYQLPAAQVNLAGWHKRMAKIKLSDLPSEKLYS